MKVRQATIQEWWDFVNACPTATFFHTPDWYQVWEDYAGLRYEALIFHFNNGSKALLPFAWKYKMKGLYRSYQSSPAGTYGSVLSNNKLNQRAIDAIRKHINKLSCVVVRDNPLAPVHLGANCKNDFTQLILLSELNGDVTGAWSKNIQRNLKKSHAQRLIVKLAQSKEDWMAYFNIYQQSLLRWGSSATSNYTWLLFENIHRLANQKCRLWLVQCKEDIVSGYLCFYHNRHAVYWHGASTQTAFKLSAVPFLVRHVINDAKVRGFKYFDFNPSGGHEGVVKFKKGFGTVKSQANIFTFQKPSIALIKKLGKSIRVC